MNLSKILLKLNKNYKNKIQINYLFYMFQAHFGILIILVKIIKMLKLNFALMIHILDKIKKY